MKVYSIGRDSGCDIVITDNTDVISRRHALLNVSTWGKYTIVDNSTNGTYVNGIRISPNVPVPVTRKDMISFAHVQQFDWGRVPKSNLMRYVLLALAALIIISCSIWGAYQWKKSGDAPNPPSIVNTDTLKQENKEIGTPIPSSARTNTKKETEDNRKEVTPKENGDNKKDSVKTEEKKPEEAPKPKPIG